MTFLFLFLQIRIMEWNQNKDQSLPLWYHVEKLKPSTKSTRTSRSKLKYSLLNQYRPNSQKQDKNLTTWKLSNHTPNRPKDSSIWRINFIQDSRLRTLKRLGVHTWCTHMRLRENTLQNTQNPNCNLVREFYVKTEEDNNWIKHTL